MLDISSISFMCVSAFLAVRAGRQTNGHNVKCMMDEATEDRGMITSQQALFDPDQKTRKCPSMTTLKVLHL